MKKNQIRKSVAALAMAAVVSVSLLGYGCGSKSASSTAGVSGEFTGTAKGMGGDVTVTLTLTDGKITGCTAEGKDETPGIGTMALEQLPGAIAESGSIAVDGVATATITSDAIKEAAAAALAAAGLNADDYKTEVKADTTKAEDSTIDADIAIVGAGGAGMTAAITAAAEGKSDPDFGRTSFAKALDTAPYYAIKVTAGVHHTMGGLKINTNTEVLKADGSVIPGLFAAGEVTGGVHGANRLGGNAVADFTVFGRIAGAAASKYAA